MDKSKPIPAAPTKSKSNGATEREDLASLKEILFQEEQAQLANLDEQIRASRLDEDQLSEMLPSAVRISASRNDKLGTSLAPMIGTALQKSIEQDPENIVDAISPIMGPAIRDSIRQAIQAMQQSLNKTLEHSVSSKGLKWRWEAFTTGKPFAEVVMINTMLYRVVQLFLIHNESGLLIQHAGIDSEENQSDADLKSSMLQAIQDFGRDSFGAGEDDALSFNIGDSKVWVVTGPHAYLAAEIKGEAPLDTVVKFQECLETIHIEYGKYLGEFNGDSSPFQSVKPLMGDYLLSAYGDDQPTEKIEKPTPQKMTKGRKRLWMAAAVGLLAGLWMFSSFLAARRQTAEIKALLAVPDTVAVELRDKTLFATGKARNKWIEQTQSLAPRISGIEQLDLSELINQDQPWLEYVEYLRKQNGIIVTWSETNGGAYRIEGLWDPTVESPIKAMDGFALDPRRVTHKWTKFFGPK